MNKIERQPYFILVGITLPNGGNPIMCSFCWYGECTGDCEDGWFECLHPLHTADLGRIPSMVENVMDGTGDCFLFRPVFAPEVAADIVGIWLQGKVPDWATVPRLGQRAKQ